jgi:histidinol-phosphate/aromatic aminotransferase/cobyric acid decarboxylase-like protein
VAAALARLRRAAGTHSPSVAELERALPGVVRVDACFLSNPYATDLVLRRLRELDPGRIERIVSHYPSQSGAIASVLAPTLAVPADQLVVANGACEVIAALLANAPGPVLVSLPTFSAYYEFASGPVIPHRLDPAAGFRLDLEELEALVERHNPDTVVVINPNNPDGGLVAHRQLVEFVARVQGRVRQVIVDESFAAFTSLDEPATLAPLVTELPHLVVVNSLSKSHGIAGLRPGYAIATPLRARQLRRGSLWNLNAFAEWLCELLTDTDYQHAYERARRRYIRETRRLFTALAQLPGAHAHPSSANYALLELDTREPDRDRPTHPPRRLRPRLRRQMGPRRRPLAPHRRPHRTRQQPHRRGTPRRTRRTREDHLPHGRAEHPDRCRHRRLTDSRPARAGRCSCRRSATASTRTGSSSPRTARSGMSSPSARWARRG